MFTKILIANRGEIACRIIETARRMGIATVAVYSDADRRARFVRMADEAVPVGGAAASESYLKGDVILRAALDTGAQAIHPGYGFLSENAAFAESCAKAGIKFIGPSAGSITAMGLKDKAKDIMAKAGVPVVPGYQGDNQAPVVLAGEAGRIGYPVLIKAVAGGGGKGMRLVERAEDFEDALKSCQREAKSSFGNDHVLIEKYITKPRHVEVQVFGDAHGGAVHLFERDCSLQRRHQKVVEEAPAPGLPDAVRRALGDTAVRAVRALGYENAGTIEFIMDSQTHDFFFMEMNTRLQVEHPVTEMVTGLDLVEWQLRVAAGEKLPLAQDQIKCNGHAFEVRLYAEDPAGEFLPQTGTVEEFFHPAAARVDAGVEAGDSVTIHYDPMIAKLIAHGKDRAEAVQTMRDALEQTGIAGLRTNQEFLHRVFTQADFIAGKVDTGFIARHMDELVPADYGLPDAEDCAIAALYFLTGGMQREESGGSDPWAVRDNWRMGGVMRQSLTLMIGRGDPVKVDAACRDGLCRLSVGGADMAASRKALRGGIFTAYLDGRERSARVAGDERAVTLFRNGRAVALHIRGHGGGEDEGAGEGRIITPMPGRIIDVFVKHGDTVEKGQPLLVMEAMKMEMTIRAGCAGTVEDLPVSANDQVQDGALLVLIRGEDAA